MLSAEGWEVIGVSRKGTGDAAGISKWTTPAEADLSNCDAVVNLSGEPIDQRWTEKNKRAFHSSRIGVTSDIVKKISALNEEHRPKFLLNASAVGYYGGRGDEVLDETAIRGEGYLADLCAEWEEAALPAEALGVRVARLRIGVVLGRGGKAFEKLLTVFKAGIGGRLGNGKQWTPWIHVDDLRRAIVFSLNHPAASVELCLKANGRCRSNYSKQVLNFASANWKMHFRIWSPPIDSWRQMQR